MRMQAYEECAQGRLESCLQPCERPKQPDYPNQTLSPWAFTIRNLNGFENGQPWSLSVQWTCQKPLNWRGIWSNKM